MVRLSITGTISIGGRRLLPQEGQERAVRRRESGGASRAGENLCGNI